MQFAVVPLYMAAIYLGAITAPGVGIMGRAMSSAPGSLLDWSHAPLYGVLYWMLARGLQQRGWPDLYAVIMASVTAFVFGIWMEIFQASVPERTTSLEDLFLNGIGIGIAAISQWYLDNSRCRGRRGTISSLQPGSSHQQG